MDRIVRNCDNDKDLDILSEITDFWRNEDLKQQLGSTEDSDFNIINDKNVQSHMQWHLRDDQDSFKINSADSSFLRSQNQNESRSVNQSFRSSKSRTTNSQRPKERINRKFSILICTDFAFPKFGGVETHGYQLAQCLIERGHKVCFITNKYQDERGGVRCMANGLKVYHLPHRPVLNGDVAFMSFFNCLPLIRQILIREHIDIVHGHQSTSVLQHCVMMAAKAYGLKTVFTEHSLFGYNDLTGIHLNKVIKWSFRDLDAAICVSHACKDNFVLRAKVAPQKAFTIPNAVDSNRFTPDPSIRENELAQSGNPDQINIVFISRLQYRKGFDLLIRIIPKILAQFEHVNFIIGGDGSGMVHLEELVERHNLHGRVELLGGLPHDKVRDVLCRGHIFLNTSLTESFCIAILEAACCGLLVVTTDVGGVPEVLPPHMAYLAKPDEKSILRQLRKAVVNVKNIPVDKFYSEVASIYSWRQVAERTERVYDYVMEKPVPNIMSRIKSSVSWGPLVGVWGIFYTIIETLCLWLVELMLPECDIDVVRSFNTNAYNVCPSEFGNHQVRVDAYDRADVKPSKIIDIDYESNKQKLHVFDRQNRYSTVRPTMEQVEEREDQLEIIPEETEFESVGGSSFISKIEQTLFGVESHDHLDNHSPTASAEKSDSEDYPRTKSCTSSRAQSPNQIQEENICQFCTECSQALTLKEKLLNVDPNTVWINIHNLNALKTHVRERDISPDVEEGIVHSKRRVTKKKPVLPTLALQHAYNQQPFQYPSSQFIEQCRPRKNSDQFPSGCISPRLKSIRQFSSQSQIDQSPESLETADTITVAGTDQPNIIDSFRIYHSENIKAFELDSIEVSDLKPSKLNDDQRRAQELINSISIPNLLSHDSQMQVE